MSKEGVVTTAVAIPTTSAAMQGQAVAVPSPEYGKPVKPWMFCLCGLIFLVGGTIWAVLGVVGDDDGKLDPWGYNPLTGMTAALVGVVAIVFGF